MKINSLFFVSQSGWSSWRRISGMDSSTYCMCRGSSFFPEWFLGGIISLSSFFCKDSSSCNVYHPRLCFWFISFFVQFLTRTVWWAIPTIWLPVVCYVLSISARKGLTFPQIALIVAFGVLTWTLLEYTLHRFLFHIETKSYWLVQYQWSCNTNITCFFMKLIPCFFVL